MSKKQQYEPSQDLIDDIKAAFAMFDAKESGKIDEKRFKEAVATLGFHPKIDETRRMISEVDPDDSGKPSYEHFLELMSTMMAAKDDRVQRAFRLFDEEGTGVINIASLRRAARKLDEKLTEEELREMMELVDRDGDGSVTPDDFLRVLRRTNLY